MKPNATAAAAIDTVIVPASQSALAFRRRVAEVAVFGRRITSSNGGALMLS